MDAIKTLDHIGATHVCQWRDNKTCAFSMGADDSIHSQLDFMIPEMLKRGFAGTFWINPGRGTTGEWGFCWESRRDEWLAAARKGCDFGNHTVYHVGARYYAEAEYEIGESARIIWAANPGQKLQLFKGGGGTTWNVAPEEVDEILAKYYCVRGRGGGVDDNCIDAGSDALKGYVDAAIREGSWHLIACHGVGPTAEWLPTSGEAFVALLDYLVEKKDLVWVGTNTRVHKYDQERASAQATVLEASPGQIRLQLTSAKDPALYDEPLTLRTQVPTDWAGCLVTQGRSSKSYPASAGVVQYEAVPGSGMILLAPAAG